MTNPLTPEEREALTRILAGLEEGTWAPKSSDSPNLARAVTRLVEESKQADWIRDCGRRDGSCEVVEHANIRCSYHAKETLERRSNLLEDCWAILAVTFCDEKCDHAVNICYCDEHRMIDRIKAELGPLAPPVEPTDSSHKEGEKP